MAKKYPFKLVRISNTIYEALTQRRATDAEDDYKPISMTRFIENILWAYTKKNDTKRTKKELK